MAYVALGLIVVLFLVIAGYAVWRVRNADSMEAGGSMGHQMLERDEEDWGPKS